MQHYKISAPQLDIQYLWFIFVSRKKVQNLAQMEIITLYIVLGMSKYNEA